LEFHEDTKNQEADSKDHHACDDDSKRVEECLFAFFLDLACHQLLYTKVFNEELHEAIGFEHFELNDVSKLG
jgi:hypothetical protein